MKKHFNLLNAFRILMMVAAALALYLPAKHMLQKTNSPVQTKAQEKLPDGIRLAGGQSSWQVVSALAY